MIMQVYRDQEELNQVAAGLFVRQARESLCKGQFSVALSGGNTPRPIYELLSRSPFMEEIPWGAVHFFWGDERWVAPSSPDSNERMVRKALLDHIPVPEDQIYPMYYPGKTAQDAAKAYDNLLRDFFVGEKQLFDLVFLGLGENGHTASLFPHTPVLGKTRRWVEEVFITEEDQFRITLTAEAINQSALVVFIVSGAEKADILRQVLEGPYQPEQWPAQLIRPTNGKLWWLVDEAAAQKLSQPIGTQSDFSLSGEQ